MESKLILPTQSPRFRPPAPCSCCFVFLLTRPGWFFIICLLLVFLCMAPLLQYHVVPTIRLRNVSLTGNLNENAVKSEDDLFLLTRPEGWSTARPTVRHDDAPDNEVGQPIKTTAEADDLSELEVMETQTEGVDHNDAYLVDTPGCRIPYMEPINPEVKDFVYDYNAVVCEDPPPLVESNGTAVYVVRDRIPDYNTTEAELQCCFRSMERFAPNITVPDWDSEEGSGDGTGPLHDTLLYDNDIRFGETCEQFNTSALVPHEFIRVECTAEGKEVYRDMHAFVPQKRPRGYCGELTPPDAESLNVLLVGIDAVSRLNYLRKMPLTRAFLNNTLHAVELVGYNKVEDNTFPNLLPLLTGFNVSEISQTCWPDSDAHFDACPFVWKEFNRHGYVTAFAEDTAWIGLFHYLKYGFIQQPTDYDPRPLMYGGEKEFGRKEGFCISQRHQITVLLNYAKKYIEAMKEKKQKMFGLFWGISLSHDFLNEPDEADSKYESFLRDLHHMGVLNNTALIFMSDHGLRWGDIVSTYQGHLEERLPIMSVVLPEWFKNQYPKAFENLNINQRRLMTVYDLHATFRDFMNLRRIQDKHVIRRTKKVTGLFKSRQAPRGVSLFTSIPVERTCAEAGIPMHYCACLDMSRVPKNSGVVSRVATFVVDSVNHLLSNFSQCAHLSIHDVHDAWRNNPVWAKQKYKEHVYQIKLHTQPGNALISATVRHNLKSSAMTLAGSVSRLNAYGTQSLCVPDFKLRLYCYCNSTS